MYRLIAHSTMKAMITIATIILLTLLDSHLCSIVTARGGFEAWTNYNPFWSLAVAYLAMIHIIAVIALYAYYNK